MTTIAYKDGLIAVDSRETFGDQGHEHCHPCQKLFYVVLPEVGTFAIATAGESVPGLLFVDKFRRIWSEDSLEKLREEFAGADFEALVLHDPPGAHLSGEPEVYWFDKWLRCTPVEDLECFAIGSGAKVALGAMKAGASAQRAVEIATTIDPYTQYPVVVGDPRGVRARILP